jgi:1,4-dihydroxy-2-naphthoate octaprenyltransferase
MFKNWLEIFQTCNLSPERRMDPISKWLVITRACVFSMTFIAGLIGALLAAEDAPLGWADIGYAALAVVGVVLAHATNNMINDYFDLAGGVDTDDYTRAQYAPHPVLSGLISKSQLVTAIVIANVIDLAIGVFLLVMRGPLVAVFAGLGIFFSVFYVAPPLKLKHHGLGELSLLLVWGPLIIGGVYYVTLRDITLPALAAAVPYGMLLMAGLTGKHVDKYEQDKAKGIHTLPVIIGEKAARHLAQVLFVGFYVVIIALVGVKIIGVWALLVLVSVPRLIRVLKEFAKPKPAAPPEDFPLWPLWFVTLGVWLTRFVGSFYILGLILNVVFPIPLPW